MKIKKKDMTALVACAMLAGFSLIVSETVAQRIWYLFFAAFGIGAGYVLSKRIGTGKWEVFLYAAVAALSILSMFFEWDTFTHGRWLATPIVYLYIPGLFLLMLPLLVWLKDQRKPLLTACTLGVLVLISLLMKSVDGFILCFIGIIAVLEQNQKTARTIVIALGITLYVLMLWHDSGVLTHVGTKMWQNLRMVGSAQSETIDSLFQTAVLEGDYTVAEVLYSLGVIPLAALLAAFSLIFARLVNEKRRAAQNYRLFNACVIFFVVRIAAHLIGTGLLIANGAIVSGTALPLMGNGCSVFAEYAILVCVLLGSTYTAEETTVLLER